jgi:hypothetical protein
MIRKVYWCLHNRWLTGSYSEADESSSDRYNIETRYSSFSPLCCFSYMHFVLICTVVVLYCFVMCVCVCVRTCVCVGFVMCVCVCVCVWMGVLVICILYSEVFLNLSEVFLTQTEVFRSFSSVVRQLPE